MKKLVIGILAHVDAGKTTLSESILYQSGKIGKPGRVDNKNAYLDTFELERERGITIFSKQAVFEVGEIQITLMDTPGHVDFSSEMERTLQILDYAVLVISGADGVQGHTRTLWNLLHMYRIPVFLFINKMDQAGTDRNGLLDEIKRRLDDNCIDFSQDKTENFFDQVAMCDEGLMEHYLETGGIEEEWIKQAVYERKIVPCCFGSALKQEGIDSFLQTITSYAQEPSYPDEFGAKIFKITRDEQGNRLTHMKITGGNLKVKDSLTNHTGTEKVNQIRIYSGEKFHSVNQVSSGTVCAVTGLSQTRAGQGLGRETSSDAPVLGPVLLYRMILPKEWDQALIMPKLLELEEEEPQLHIIWDEKLQEIQVQLMGEVQTEILQSLIQERFGVWVTFDTGRIAYRETIENMVEGAGHFEPLRHYAEVHVLMEPGESGSGLVFDTKCSEDILDKNWQRLVLFHLKEKVHKGVLTGSEITDMKITLVSGRAHKQHTEGGDFREAACRAVRQGLKEAESVLLEPFYSFSLELPEKMIGRAMADIEKMHGTCELFQAENHMSVLVGSAPVVTMRNYQREVTAYTKGMGRLFCHIKGYEPCHNAEEVIREIGYDWERDTQNPAGSVFCQKGAGFFVNWDEAKGYMHVENYLQKKEEFLDEEQHMYSDKEEPFISTEEIDRIIYQTSYANQGKKTDWKRQKPARTHYHEVVFARRPIENKDEYLLVDGYNIIYAWPELAEHADHNMDGARMKLLDYLSNYQGIRKCKIIVVFDAYRVLGHQEEVIKYQNIHMVYTKEAQTADQYIEKFAYDNQKKYHVTVATSDGLQQLIIRGAGCTLLSARELKVEIESANENVQREFQDLQEKNHNYFMDTLTPDTKRQLEDLIEKNPDKD